MSTRKQTHVTPLKALQTAAFAAGGQSALAQAIGLADRRQVWPWFRGRRVPLEHCPAIEFHTGVACEQLRPDVAWMRVPDPGWPTTKGRPGPDFFGPVASQV